MPMLVILRTATMPVLVLHDNQRSSIHSNVTWSPIDSEVAGDVKAEVQMGLRWIAIATIRLDIAPAVN